MKSSNIYVGKYFHCGRGTYLWAPNSLRIGDNVYIGKYCTIESDGEIGDGCLIANNVGIVGKYDHDHRSIGYPIRCAPWIGSKDYTGLGKGLNTVIGSDVWIGYNAVILGGISVGRGSIIGAGSIVTKDVNPYEVVAGVPAKKVGERMNKSERKIHESEMAKWKFIVSERGYNYWNKLKY